MSRKHFQSIANAVKQTARDTELTPHQHYILARNMSHACQEHNANFNRDIFYTACGLKVGKDGNWTTA